jgi:hypothetical protein
MAMAVVSRHVGRQTFVAKRGGSRLVMLNGVKHLVLSAEVRE